MTRTSRKKKNTRKKDVRPGQPPPRLPLAEVLAVIFGALGVFLGLAVLSYHPSDPSWSLGGDTGPARNWMGPVGAYVADVLVSPLGFPSLVIPMLLLGGAARLLRYHRINWPLLRVVAGCFLTFFACLLLAFYPGEVLLRGELVPAGGWVGKETVSEMVLDFNRPGTLVLVLAGLVVSLQLTLHLEIGPPLIRLGGWLRTLVRGTARITGTAVMTGAEAVGHAAAAGVSTIGHRLEEGAERQRGTGMDDDLWGFDSDARDPNAMEGDGDGDNGPKSKKQWWRRETDSPEASDSDPGSSSPEKNPNVTETTTDQETAAQLPPPAIGFDNTGDLIHDEETADTPGKATKSKSRPRRAGTATDTGPKIIKSKYMEAPSATSIKLVPEPEDNFENYKRPPLDLLTKHTVHEDALTEEDLRASAKTLEEKLRDYGVEGRVVEIHPGPVITMYEYAPAPGVKVSKITNLSNDLALALRALAVRIIAPLPGKAAVGIEVPNPNRQMVYLRDVVEHEEFQRDALALPVAIGKDIEGKPYATDLARMPHLLVAGATGTGKSVAVNAMLISLLYCRTPDEVRLILVDPKIIEFSVYDDIPHLLMPVVTDPSKAARALNWAVNEMSTRYKLLTREGTRNIASYNRLMDKKLEDWDFEAEEDGTEPPKRLPYILIVIDELADLMMVAGKEVQDAIVRLAQMARAAGIHMIVATQRPSVDVITGLIKANFPARIAFKVSSKTDSRTILDANGAECLLGLGDMLFVPPGTASLRRLHGAFVSDEEARLVIKHLKEQAQPRFEESLLSKTEEDPDNAGMDEEEAYDEKYELAKEIVLESGMASISTIQRKLKIGYNRSARMVERMAKEGLIGPPVQGGKPREIFADKLRESLQ